MTLPPPVRFFVIVPVVPNATLWGFALAVAAGCTVIAVDVSYADRTLAPVLLLQLFAAASGFRVPARRGHFDPLFTSGTSRLAIGATHWVMSVFPGILAWCALAATEHAAGGASLTASGTILAIVVTSTVPWSSTVPMPRLTGAILWLLIFVTAAAAWPPRGDVGMGPLLPWAFVGRHLRAAEAATLIAVALAGVGGSLWLISNMDVPLESSQ